MEILILVALLAFAAAVTDLPELSSEQETWIGKCIKNTNLNVDEINNLRAGNFEGSALSDSAKNFLFCYLEQNGMFSAGKPNRVVIVRKLVEGGDANAAQHLEACNLNDELIYNYEALYEFCECYMERSNKPLDNWK